MNRRDTIIVAVLLNAAVIAVLLMMAVNTDEEIYHNRSEFISIAPDISPQAEVKGVLSANPMEPKNSFEVNSSENPSKEATGNRIIVDLEAVGFDSLLNDYTSNPNDLFLVADDLGLVLEKPLQQSSQSVVQERLPENEMAGVKIVEVTVKKGDSLDRIARANGTTIEAIKRLSQLKSERLSIGQILKVPVGFKKSSSGQIQIAQSKNTPKITETTSSSDVVYYTIKSGDNPWKIAKQQRLDIEELLRLNNLNEEKARNLKIGDRIRIR